MAIIQVMKDSMGPIDSSLGAKPIVAHDIPVSKWEASSSDRRLDNSGLHGKEGSAKDKSADEASRKAINSRINGKRK